MPPRKSGFSEAPPANYKTSRGTSMGGLGSAKERAAVGLNPVPGLDVDLEDVGGLPQNAVTATVEALSALIESGRPEFRDKTWVPHRPPRPEKSEGGVPLKIVSELTPEGRPADGDRRTGRRHRGAGARPGAARRHRLGQDLHHGQGDRGDPAAGADPRAQQDARRPALWRVQVVLPGERGRVFRLLLRLLPAGGLRPAHRHLYREGILHQRADRPHAPLGDALAARTRRRHHRRLGVVHLRHRLGRDLYGDDLRAHGRRAHRPAPASRRSGGAAIQARRRRFPPRHLPRARRHRRPVPGPSGGPRLARRAVRRRDRIDHRVRPADRPEGGQPQAGQGLRQLALCHAAADARPGGEGHQGGAASCASTS